jgi:asparagine N-glycosylation enzyme membrane subunit Stt3
MVRKHFLPLIIASLIIVTLVLAFSIHPFQTSVKEIGGKYDAIARYWGDSVLLTYTDESGSHSSSHFDNSLLTGLNWINSSTPENGTFLCWWDYGHMLKAIGERNPIVRNPSPEILNSIVNPSGIQEFDSHEKIFDVASAFATSNQTTAIQIMEKYGADYIMVGKNDLANVAWFFKIAGLDYTDYLIAQKGGLSFTELGKNTLIAKLLDNNVDFGLVLVYQDQEMKIYKLGAEL